MKRRLLIAGSLIWACLVMQARNASANNIAVTNIGLTDSKAAYTHVQLDVGWDNSWRIAGSLTNWDAAWVFVKYRLTGGPWKHATLATNGHTGPAGCTIDPASDGTGAFIYRSSDGTGATNYAGVKLRWNYAEDGLRSTQSIDVAVHAIEMVYIPEGAFYLGSGGSENGHFYQYTDGSQTTNPYPVTSEAAITTSTNTSGDLWGTGVIGGINAPAPSNGSVISNAFPKGYAAFYCMKYEIGQGQYADFLNKLTDAQDTNRYPNTNGYFRHTISGSYTNYTASVPDRACNYITWMDGCAYADWAGLRPMTELEFEKACRGPEAPVANEYAWGNTTIIAPAWIIGDGSPTSTVNKGNCNYSPAAPGGPFRCGIFAASTNNPTRTQAGATYYGVMEMSGSMWTHCVSIGRAEGRVFTGTHGDGVLSYFGHATNADWPGYISGFVTGSTGAGARGGSWPFAADYARVSDRYYGVYDFAGDYRAGRRAVRSAP